MKNHSLLTFIIVYIIAIAFSLSMNAKRCFVVTDEMERPIEGAVLAVTDSVTRRITEVSITDKEGQGCLLKKIKAGSIINITANGFLTYKIPSSDPASVVALEHDATDLDEITVVATQDHLSQKGGTFIFTPGSLKTEVSSIYDLLKYVPLVNNESGQFKLTGRPDFAKIKINGEEPREWGAGISSGS